MRVCTPMMRIGSAVLLGATLFAASRPAEA